MQLVDFPVAKPASGEVCIQHKACGLNFIDVYYRTGLYKQNLPAGLGSEGAGVVEEVGPDVADFKVGDRVAYGSGPLGAYSEKRNFPANRLVKLTKAISDETAAGMMLKGMTVRYLLRATYKVKRGQTVLFHAAAGGVGLIFSQWAKALGVKVIGTVGSAEKMQTAYDHGCAHVINSSTEDVAARVKEITKGQGVPVVYDGVGKATFQTSLECLSLRGMLVSFGNASGPVTGIGVGVLTPKALYISRPTLGAYTSTDAEFQETAQDVIDIVKSGKVKIAINQRYALKDASQAHQDLEARRTTGASVLIP